MHTDVNATAASPDCISEPDPARGTSSATRIMTIALAVIAGFVAGRLQTSARAASPEGNPASAAMRLSVEDWRAKAAALGDGAGPGDPAVRDQLVAALEARPELRSRLLDGYSHENDPHQRGVMRGLFAAIPRDELGVAARTMAESADTIVRTAGFELTSLFEVDETVFAMAHRRVLDEQDPDALAAALAALSPPVQPSSADRAEMLPRLVALTHHAHIGVRASAIQRVAEWDLSGALATPVVETALGDPERLVRQAAVGAVMVGGLREARLVPGLLQLLVRADEDLAIRGPVLLALERFPLSDADHAAYVAAHAEIERLAGKR
jgi:hypothetical protein